MKIAIATVGSQGDVQPYLALAVGLKRAGHTVRLATSDLFGPLVKRHGLDFAPLGAGIKEVFGDEGRTAMNAAQGKLVQTFRSLRRYAGPLIRQGLERLPAALAGADVIIGQLLVPGAYHYAERYRIPYFEATCVPSFPTRAFAYPAAPVNTPRGILSWLTYVGAEQLFWQAFRSDLDRFRVEVLGLPRAPLLGPNPLRAARRLPMLMAYSNKVIARPADWPAHATVTGYWFLDEPEGWTPPPRLVDFLAAGEAPVYLGFGSMSVDDPEQLTRTLLAGIRATGCRAILSRGWGALCVQPDSERVIFVEDVPHSWLFPQLAAVVHHGGAGTTAAALRAGVPQLVVSFVADQPFWGHQVARLGAGPPHLAIQQLTPDLFISKLAALQSPQIRHKAGEIGVQIRAERGVDIAVAIIESAARKPAAA